MDYCLSVVGYPNYWILDILSTLGYKQITGNKIKMGFTREKLLGGYYRTGIEITINY